MEQCGVRVIPFRQFTGFPSFVAMRTAKSGSGFLPLIPFHKIPERENTSMGPVKVDATLVSNATMVMSFILHLPEVVVYDLINVIYATGQAQWQEILSQVHQGDVHEEQP